MADPTDLDLLDSNSARTRLEGIRRIAEAGGPVAPLLPLLEDDAPYVFNHAGRPHIAEVRADALVAVQDLYRRAGRTPDFGPVTVRKAMPADDARSMAHSLLSALPEDVRRDLLARVDEDLGKCVQPQPFEVAACRAYCVLQALGRVPYLQQEPDEKTLLTPLQQEINQSQVQSDRPVPHLRFDGDQGRLGFLYRQDGRWVHDFSDAPESKRVQRMLGSFMRAERGQLPRVVGAAEGKPQKNPDGSLVLDGTVPRDVDDPVEYLASLAAFCEGLFTCELVQ